MKYFISIFVFFILMACSELSSPEEVNIAVIKDILENIEHAFNFDNLEEIMLNYHPDFLHNGDNYQNEELRWQIRLIDFVEIKIENIEIDFLTEFSAIAGFKLIFKTIDDELEFSEPSNENGDISFFHKESGVWKILGNQTETRKEQL